MALQLLRELPSGVSGEYWRINYVTVNCNDTPYTQIWLSLYVNRQARLDNKASMHTEELKIPLQDIDSTYSYDFRACLYNSIKKLPGWETAVDVYDDPNRVPLVFNSSCTTTVDVPVETTLSAIDLYNLPLTYSIVDNPANGDLVLVGNVATYTPAAEYTGDDSFTFIVNNGEFDSAFGIVSIVVNPVDAPVVDAPGDVPGDVPVEVIP
jgi:hypothetical protein